MFLVKSLINCELHLNTGTSPKLVSLKCISKWLKHVSIRKDKIMLVTNFVSTISHCLPDEDFVFRHILPMFFPKSNKATDHNHSFWPSTFDISSGNLCHLSHHSSSSECKLNVSPSKNQSRCWGVHCLPC